ncbi:MAG: hypothetical protein ACRDT1_16415, partial [Micromonosporaceae bacterium]
MGDEAKNRATRAIEVRDLAIWLILGAIGLLLCWAAVKLDARLGTASPPFQGRYTSMLTPGLAASVGTAAAVLAIAARGGFERLRWGVALLLGYGFGLCWSVTLVWGRDADGAAIGTGDLGELSTDAAGIGADPRAWLQNFTDPDAAHSWAARSHPPGPVLLLWMLRRLGLHDQVTIQVLLAGVAALAIPLVLAAARSACGEVNARRLLPVVVLAPYALWSSSSIDSVVTVLGAAMILAGVRASERRGWRAALWGVGSGLLLGLAALFGYAAAWLGLSVICLYFARRRPFLNVLTGFGALAPMLLAQLLGFSWVAGLLSAPAHYTDRIDPGRAALWWAGLSLVVLLLAAGPPLVASLRKLRNTPGWPFLVGAGAAVAFSVLTGFAQGGAEVAWLPFFPWLTIAATAPQQQAGP